MSAQSWIERGKEMITDNQTLEKRIAAIERQLEELKMERDIEKSNHVYWHKIACISMGMNAAIIMCIVALIILYIAKR